MSKSTSVYVCRQGGSVAYVGITSDLVRRHREHRRYSWWWTADIELDVLREFEERTDARTEESRLIAQFRPPFNVHHNDNASCLRPPSVEMRGPESGPMCIDCGEREQLARQLCRGCGQRWRRAGRELPRGSRNRQTWDEVVADVRADYADNECWPWKKAISPDGYAVGGSQFGTTSATRAMFIHLTGEDLAGKRLVNLCHDTDPDCLGGADCSHRRCVNPAHATAVPIATVGDDLPRCLDCGLRPAKGRGLCRVCRRRRVDDGVPLPKGERNRQTWEEILADVRLGRSEDECWPWTKSVTDQGYGISGATRFGTRLAHRAAFIHFTGQDITGLELDHLCHNNDSTCTDGPMCPHRRCVNPRHLEVVTGEVNLARRKAESMAAGAAKRVERKTHCANEHELTEDNIYWFRNKRLCRICRAESRRRAEEKKKARAA